MKTQMEDVTANPTSNVAIETFSGTLGNGRQIILRKVLAKDLLEIERQTRRKNLGPIEQSMKMMERVSVSPGKITFKEIEKLTSTDFAILAELLADAGEVISSEDDDYVGN